MRFRARVLVGKGGKMIGKQLRVIRRLLGPPPGPVV